MSHEHMALCAKLQSKDKKLASIGFYPPGYILSIYMIFELKYGVNILQLWRRDVAWAK